MRKAPASQFLSLNVGSEQPEEFAPDRDLATEAKLRGGSR
jgi:hypothetical protein